MAANVNGSTLSSLLHSQCTDAGDQEGFLLGRLANHVKDKISDSQISNFQVETVMYVHSHWPWPTEPRIHCNAGQIKHSMVQTLLKEKEKEVVGWYRCRRNSSLRVSMREASLHQSLTSQLSGVTDADNFLFLLVTTAAAGNLATHSLDYTLFTCKRGHFVRIPVRVVNLGDTTHSEYRSQPSVSLGPTCQRLHSVVTKFKSQFEDVSGNMIQVQQIGAMSDNLHKQLLNLGAAARESEEARKQLEDAVQSLTQKLTELEEIKRRSQPPPSLPLPCGDTAVKETQQVQDPGEVTLMDLDVTEESRNQEWQPLAPVTVKTVEQKSQVCDRQSKRKTNTQSDDKSQHDTQVVTNGGLDSSTDSLTNGLTSQGETNPSQRNNEGKQVEKVPPGVQQSSRNARGSKETSPANADHFSFVDSLLSKEKSLTLGSNTGDTMSVPSGEKIKKPASATTKNNVNAAGCKNKGVVHPEGKAENTQPLKKVTDVTDGSDLSHATARAMRARSQKTRSRTAQTQRSRSSEDRKNERGQKTADSRSTAVETDDLQRDNKVADHCPAQPTVVKNDSRITAIECEKDPESPAESKHGMDLETQPSSSPVF